MTKHRKSVTSLRRFLFGLVLYIDDTQLRIMLSLALCLVNLVHHTAVKPFKHNQSNRSETLSLSLLILLCFINFHIPPGLNIWNCVKHQDQNITI